MNLIATQVILIYNMGWNGLRLFINRYAGFFLTLKISFYCEIRQYVIEKQLQGNWNYISFYNVINKITMTCN